MKGNIVALVTPFTQDGAIDFEALTGLIEYQIKGGIEGILLGGTTGETPCLSESEYAELLRHGYNTIKGRVDIIAGVGTSCTKSSVHRAQVAREIGITTGLIVTPPYNKPPPEGLYLHFSTVAHEVPSMNFILYNVPGRTGVDLPDAITCRLASLPNVVGIKDATGDIQRLPNLRRMLASVAPDFKIYSGNDDMAKITHETHKFDGVISVTANILPGLFRRDLDNDKMATIIKLHQIIFCMPNPIPMKYLLFKAGLIKNVLRLPLIPMEEGVMADGVSAAYADVLKVLGGAKQ